MAPDPLPLDPCALREEVATAVARGAETPDFFSTRPGAELQAVLRDTPTRSVETLLNKGDVRYDFENRRIYRDSFWKGSFARDTLLGWEERVRSAALGQGIERIGAHFAAGSFWKRFDKIENGVARGRVVNYELQWLPGDPEVREVEYPDDRRSYFKKGDRILLLTYRNHPYKIVYDTIKVLDDQNAIGVMHLGDFPNGMEFSTFVMARQNYPFEKMALDDHRALFSGDRATRPSAADMAGEWIAHLVFLGRPDISLLNKANPALFRVTFRHEGDAVTAGFRLNADGNPDPAFQVQDTTALMQDNLRIIGDKTMLARWTLPDIAPGLLSRLDDYVQTEKGRPVFHCVLTRPGNEEPSA
jgi:hypothetical protein